MMARSNSKTAALYCRVLDASEPQPDGDAAMKGIYIGKTGIYKIPFFLDSDRLVNPHISIVGTTGSGKTYLVKSMLTVLGTEKLYGILVIDWNSEYTDVVNFLCGKVWKVANAEGLPSPKELFCGVNSIDLSSIEVDSIKVSIAQEAIGRVRTFMLGLEQGTDTNKAIVIDEAWKLLNLEQGLGKLFREGRKFGLMVIAATQLVNDVNNEVLANAACSFIFRLQGSNNLEGLVSSGLLKHDNVDLVQSLDRGSCVVSLVYREGHEPRRFLIERVHGFDFKVCTIRGNSMTTSVSLRKLKSVVEGMHFDNETRMHIEKFFEDNARGVDLTQLLDFLFTVGLERADIFVFLRTLGIDDSSTAVALESLKGVEFVR